MGQNYILYPSKWSKQLTGVMGMIKPCRMELDLVLSSHMTGCDSQAPVEQIK